MAVNLPEICSNHFFYQASISVSLLLFPFIHSTADNSQSCGNTSHTRKSTIKSRLWLKLTGASPYIAFQFILCRILQSQVRKSVKLLQVVPAQACGVPSGPEEPIGTQRSIEISTL